MSNPTIILDPGHGMANRRAGRFDPGAVSAGVREADIAMDYANAIRGELLAMGGVRVVRTRIDHRDPTPIGVRADIARQYNGRIMLSIHCNSATPQATGAECFFRGDANRQFAAALSAATADAMAIRDRGAKTEDQSQHGRLAIMAFQPCFLLELGFLTNERDRAAMLDGEIRRKLAKTLAAMLRERVISGRA